MSGNSINSVIARIQSDHDDHPGGTGSAPRPVITIARDHGAGGEEIGQILARTLEVGYFDKEVIDHIVKAAGTDKALMKALDEKSKDHLGVFLYASLYGLDDPISTYRNNLIKTVIGLSRNGGVIIGRGGNLILHGRPALRVRIIGSPHICARRLGGGEPAGEPATRDLIARIEAVNAERTKFIRDMFGVRADDAINYDLVLNTDHFDRLEDAADIILRALRHHALAGDSLARDSRAFMTT